LHVILPGDRTTIIIIRVLIILLVEQPKEPTALATLFGDLQRVQDLKVALEVPVQKVQSQVVALQYKDTHTVARGEQQH